METAITILVSLLLVGVVVLLVEQRMLHPASAMSARVSTAVLQKAPPLQVIHTTLKRELNHEQVLLVDENRQQWGILTAGNLRPAKVYSYFDILNVTLENHQAELSIPEVPPMTAEEIRDQLIVQQQLYPLLITVTLRSEPLTDSILLFNIMTFGENPEREGYAVSPAAAPQNLPAGLAYARCRSLQAQEIFNLFQHMKNTARG